MSGIYFGDRCSPASSSMILTAAVTYTDARENMYKLLRTDGFPPESALSYTLSCLSQPHCQRGSSHLRSNKKSDFNISFWLVVPALLMLVLPLLKVDVKIAMGLSIISSGIACISLQEHPFRSLFGFAYWAIMPLTAPSVPCSTEEVLSPCWRSTLS